MENKERINQVTEVLSKLDSVEFGNLYHSIISKKPATQSEDIKELVSALSKAQGAMKPAVFNRVNPHFKNRYADFTSCMECCRDPLSNNGLSVMQYCETISDKLMLVTMLAHTSGQWMKSYFPLNPMKMDSQSIGSAMTYGKRYSLSAMLGIVSDDEDDDGEAAQGRGTSQQISPKPASAAFQPKQVAKISTAQIQTLKKIEEKLDADCKAKLYSWLSKQYQINSIEEVNVDIFQKVLGAFENALKFMDQQKLEVVNA